MSRSTRTYDKEFRLNAISRLKNEDITLAELASELVVPYNTIAYWVRKDKPKKRSPRKQLKPAIVTSGNEKMLTWEPPTEKLNQEIEDLKSTIIVLKKALAVCLKESS